MARLMAHPETQNIYQQILDLVRQTSTTPPFSPSSSSDSDVSLLPQVLEVFLALIRQVSPNTKRDHAVQRLVASIEDTLQVVYATNNKPIPPTTSRRQTKGPEIPVTPAASQATPQGRMPARRGAEYDDAAAHTLLEIAKSPGASHARRVPSSDDETQSQVEGKEVQPRAKESHKHEAATAGNDHDTEDDQTAEESRESSGDLDSASAELSPTTHVQAAKNARQRGRTPPPLNVSKPTATAKFTRKSPRTSRRSTIKETPTRPRASATKDALEASEGTRAVKRAAPNTPAGLFEPVAKQPRLVKFGSRGKPPSTAPVTERDVWAVTETPKPKRKSELKNSKAAPPPKNVEKRSRRNGTEQDFKQLKEAAEPEAPEDDFLEEDLEMLARVKHTEKTDDRQRRPLIKEQINKAWSDAGCAITESQWKLFDRLIEQLAEKPGVAEERGAVMVRPQLSRSKSSHLATTRFMVEQETQSAEEIRLHKRPEKWFFVRSTSKTVLLRDILDEPEKEPLPIDRFERKWLGNNSDNTPCARDIPLTNVLAHEVGVDIQTAELPGNQLKNTSKPVAGITEPYLHIGQRGSLSTLRVEHEDLWSINYLHRGYKTWVVIPPHFKAKSERFFEWVSRQERNNPNCDQFVRHIDIYVPTSTLKYQGIEFKIIHQGPGEAVIISPGTYHQGFNATYAVAETVSFASKEWLPRNYAYCNAECEKYFRRSRTNPKFAPVSLYALRSDAGSMHINPLEQIPHAKLFQYQLYLGDAHPLNKSRAGVEEGKGILGGYDARKWINLMLRFADSRAIMELNHALDPRSPFQLSNCSPLDSSKILSEELHDTYLRYIAARVASLTSSFHARLAALNLTRRVDQAYGLFNENRPHHGGHRTMRIPHIIEQTVKNLVESFSAETLALLKPMCKDQEVVELVTGHLKEMYKIGTTMDAFVRELGDNSVFVISEEDLMQYNNFLSKFLRLFVVSLIQLRPALRSLLSGRFIELKEAC